MDTFSDPLVASFVKNLSLTEARDALQGNTQTTPNVPTEKGACPACGGVGETHAVQTRSGDEGMSFVKQCKTCSHTWSL